MKEKRKKWRESKRMNDNNPTKKLNKVNTKKNIIISLYLAFITVNEADDPVWQESKDWKRSSPTLVNASELAC